MRIGLLGWRRLAAVALLFGGTLWGQEDLGSPAAGAAIEPPFNLKWGEPPGNLVDWAARFRLDVLVKAPGDQPRVKILLISAREGRLPRHESSSLEAHFIDGRLFEVSVHYTYPGREPEYVRERYLALKHLLATRYGDLRFNGRKANVSDGIKTISEACEVEPRPGNVVLLALTEMRDVKRGDAAARFSLLYHNEDILNSVPQDDESPAPP